MQSLSIGPLALPLAPVLLGVGLALASWLATRLARRSHPELAEAAGNLIFSATLVGLLAARLGHLLLNADLYLATPLDALDVRDGGWLMPAGVAAGLAWLAWGAWKTPGLRRALGVATLAGREIVELGCGAAAMARGLLQRHPNCRITGLEVDERQHAKNLAAMPVAGLRFLAGGAQAIPLPDAAFDIAWMLKSLHHVPMPLMAQALGEVARTRSGGSPWLTNRKPTWVSARCAAASIGISCRQGPHQLAHRFTTTGRPRAASCKVSALPLARSVSGKAGSAGVLCAPSRAVAAPQRVMPASVATPSARRRPGVFQAPYLIPFLDVTDNVALLPMLAGQPNAKARARALELLAALDVAHRAKAQPSELSGGEQQRVSIARALANQPPVILADEPTAPLDSERALAVMRILNQMAQQYQTAIIVVTHDEKIIPTFRRIYQIRDGRTYEEAGQGRSL